MYNCLKDDKSNKNFIFIFYHTFPIDFSTNGNPCAAKLI